MLCTTKKAHSVIAKTLFAIITSIVFLNCSCHIRLANSISKIVRQFILYRDHLYFAMYFAKTEKHPSSKCTRQHTIGKITHHVITVGT